MGKRHRGVPTAEGVGRDEFVHAGYGAVSSVIGRLYLFFSDISCTHYAYKYNYVHVVAVPG